MADQRFSGPPDPDPIVGQLVSVLDRVGTPVTAQLGGALRFTVVRWPSLGDGPDRVGIHVASADGSVAVAIDPEQARRLATLITDSASKATGA